MASAEGDIFNTFVQQWEQHKLLTRWLCKLFEYLVPPIRPFSFSSSFFSFCFAFLCR